MEMTLEYAKIDLVSLSLQRPSFSLLLLSSLARLAYALKYPLPSPPSKTMMHDTRPANAIECS